MSQMIQALVNFLTAFSKMFTVASLMHLPLDNFRNLIFSSEPMLVLLLFSFIVGETKSVIPAVLVTSLYLYFEMIPRKLLLKDSNS